LLDGQNAFAGDQLEKTRNSLGASDYWVKRFDQYGLSQIMESPPQNAEEAKIVLQEFRSFCDSLMKCT
jgi:hypothetical protein